MLHSRHSLLVAVILLFWSVDAKNIPCGAKLIDSNKMQCCFGKAELRSTDKQCCYEAREFYIARDSICCGGKIIPKHARDGVTLECCGGSVINSSSSRCCAHTENTVPPGDKGNFVCCGTHLINSTQKTCCHHRTKESLSRSYDKQQDTFCCGSKLGKIGCEWCKSEGRNRTLLPQTRDICEGKEIDLTEQSCCGGKINNLPRIDVNKINSVNTEFDCCGTKAYNTTESKCCSWMTGNTIPNLSHIQCRDDDSSYDTREYKSCEGVLHKLHSPDIQCCGNMTYDPHTHQCCNRHVFNPDSDICCGTENAAPLSKDRVCCDGEELRSGHLCCDGIKQIPRSDETHDKCCLNYWTETADSFNSDVKECIGGKLSTLSEGLKLCRDQFFDPDKAICCDGNIQDFPKDANGTAVAAVCCGGRLAGATQVCCPYGLRRTKSQPDHDACCLDTDGYGSMQSFNSQQQVCRDGQLYDRGEGEEDCNGANFSKKSAVCCNGALHSHPKGGKLKCCQPGTAAFDERLQMCCHGNVYNVSSNNAEYVCCEGKAYRVDDPSSPCEQTCAGVHFDLNTHMCCDGDLMLKGRYGDACCDGHPFYTAEQTCCSGALYRTPSGRGTCCGTSLVRWRQRNRGCCHDVMPYDARHSICTSTGLATPRQLVTLGRGFSHRGMQDKDAYQIPYCYSDYAYTGRVKAFKRLADTKAAYVLNHVTPLARFKQCVQNTIRKLTIVLHLNSSQMLQQHSPIPNGVRLLVFFNKVPNFNGIWKATVHLSEKAMAYPFVYRGRTKHDMARVTEDQCLKLYIAMDSQNRDMWKLNEQDQPWFLKPCTL